MEYLKKATATVAETDEKVRQTVKTMFEEIQHQGEEAVRKYAKQLDHWDQEFVLSEEKKSRLIAQVPQSVKEDIQFAYEQVKNFALAQKESIQEFECETYPGVRLGQRIVPVSCVGCYVPGGRYAHVASAIMSIATAKVAGVPFVIACSPPRGDSINPMAVYTMDLAGADLILEMGGAHAIISMAQGLFSGKAVDMIVGPGNSYVAEAKRMLFGPIGIDVIAGPTESAIIADKTANPMTIAVDLVSQAEHGLDSAVWFFTDSRPLGEAVLDLMPKVIADMPNHEVISSSWNHYGEVILCQDRAELVAVSDDYSAEHVQVLAEDLDWWKDNLSNYGSLFLGEGSTVTHGDKCSGTNHILPTRKAANYSGGLSVHKFLKILTYQEISTEANKVISAVGSRISRIEGMEGHARACDWRLQKYFPEQVWDFSVYDQKNYQ